MTEVRPGAARGVLSRLTPSNAAWIAAALAGATISGAWIFEHLGYAPCDLCLQQRWAYYVGAPLAVVAALVAARSAKAGGALLALLALVFAASAVFGAWHAGVEWGFWPGPAGCAGAAAPRASDMTDFMAQIQATRLVRCDEVAIRIFGLSLAGWNALVSMAIAALAGFAARMSLREHP